MYRLNNQLIVREDDKSLFSLDKMEVYEFNEVGFEAINLIHNGNIESYSQWEQEVKNIKGADVSEMKDFFQGLIDCNIIEEAL
ncbi:hypothetical protein [Butyrivibrio sp. NC3005]|uniref:hypothetical protein n=1 Tax=Butyrivibrio sp. NC3005 TaxID=1280685 RepID=UPI0004094CAE|nr:hypothetical protein [Butyrivibrio sp. NC3005]